MTTDLIRIRRLAELTAALPNPPDVAAAVLDWGANCGPVALAAVLGRTVAAVRPAFPWFPERPWTNPTQMRKAVRACGHTPYATHRDSVDGTVWLPLEGLALVQWDGPWCKPGVPAKAAYRHTHWIGIHCHGEPGSSVFDVNAGGWMVRSAWENALAPVLVHSVPRATGWYIKDAIELHPGRLTGLPPAGAAG